MKRSIVFLLFLILLAGLVVCVVMAGVTLWVLPARAEASFGPPAPGLSLIQRTRLAYILLVKKDQLKEPFQSSAAPVPFEIQLGESPQVVAQRLKEAGVIPEAQLFTDYMVYAGLDRQIQAGEYQLSPRMPPIEIAQSLQDATPLEVAFRVLPGWRVEEVAGALPTSGLRFTPQSFLNAAQNPNDTLRNSLELPPGATLEGYLFPDQYRLPRQIPLDEFLALLVQDFQAKVDRDLQAGFKDQGLSLHQAVILASMVQREAVVEDEMPMIASVFLNRLAAGMKLESDPTVQYAVGYNNDGSTWWKNPLGLGDLKMFSPFNTYQVMGLPPGPICSPGLSALRAVAYPAETPYYYFRAACDGSGKHNFARTFEEHQQNACP
jgi:UPF0755 protein